MTQSAVPNCPETDALHCVSPPRGQAPGACVHRTEYQDVGLWLHLPLVHCLLDLYGRRWLALQRRRRPSETGIFSVRSLAQGLVCVSNPYQEWGGPERWTGLSEETQQRVSWLDGITNSVDVNLSKLGDSGGQ